MSNSEATNPIRALAAQGQSAWLDNISRGLIRSGELRRLIEEDGLLGVTSNPTIFEKAITKGSEYDEQIQDLIAQGADASAIYQALTVDDIREALDVFRPVFERTEGLDGCVSLEVSPLLARDTEATIAEAKTLWGLLDRPNAMIKVPGTPEGITAIEQLLYDGININVTLLFSNDQYEQVALAYVRALKKRVEAGLPVDRINSVASFFISRIDTEVDNRIDQAIATNDDDGRRNALEALKGTVAIANAKLAYQTFKKIFYGDEFQPLRDRGAKVQRVLWASVSTKNPNYRDTLYVDDLVGAETVSTMPPETFEAVKDHGTSTPTIESDLEGMTRTLNQLQNLGISLNDATDVLLEQGVAKFADSFNALMDSIASKRQSLAATTAGGTA